MDNENNSLICTSQQDDKQRELPRAIAKEKNGIVLYWVEELGIAGLHRKGLARLLDCNSKTVDTFLKDDTLQGLVTAEIVTENGLRTVTLIPETHLSAVLRKIARSKCKEETRDRAMDALEQLAAAGFKLMVMMELAPAELAARAVSHLDSQNENIRLQNENLQLREKLIQTTSSMVQLHGEALGLAIAGFDGQVVEVKVKTTEVLNPVTAHSVEFLSANQLAQEVKRRTGQNIKNADFIRKLKAANRDDLIVAVTRNATCEYVTPESIDEAIAVVFNGTPRQRLLGM